MAALLNSDLINWYVYRFIYGKAVRTMHFDNVVTNKIPIKFNNEIVSTINTLVDGVMSDKKSSKTKIRKINQLIFTLFDLNEKERNIIIERSKYA